MNSLDPAGDKFAAVPEIKSLLLGPVYLWRELRFLSGFCTYQDRKMDV